MTSGSTFPRRLTKIDDLTRPDHHYLSDTDECYFLGEYTAREGYGYSATNQLIFNFKKSPKERGKPSWYYKGVAITEVAVAFRAAITSPKWLDNATLVPTPPSKAKSDPMYDDRMVRMLRAIRYAPPLDTRELVIQTQSTAAAHETDARPSPDEIEAVYRIDAKLLAPPPKVIAVFDDLLTTGAHFVAMKRVLGNQFPGVPIIGLFVARRAPKSALTDFEGLFGSGDS